MFIFYTIPFLVCVITGIAFFFKDFRNIPLGLLFIIGGMVPLMNIMLSIVGIVVLLVKASAKKAV